MIYKDVQEFQQKSPTREARENELEKMTYDEIMHLAHTCSTLQGSTYYARRAEESTFRNLIAPIAEDLERVWQKGRKD